MALFRNPPPTLDEENDVDMTPVVEHKASINEEKKTSIGPEITTHFNGKLKTPVTFQLVNRIPDFNKALYIQSYDEIFDILEGKETPKEIVAAHHKVKNMLSRILGFTDNSVVFIDIPFSAIPKALQQTREILGEKNFLVERLEYLQNLNKYKKEGEQRNFMRICQELKLETVYVGGMMTKGCVWDVATELAQNIFAKKPGNSHPNIRYMDTECSFRFQHAVIWEEITADLVDHTRTPADYYLFPEKAVFQLPIRGKNGLAKDSFKEMYPEKAGKDYEDFYNDEDNEKLIEEVIQKACAQQWEIMLEEARTRGQNKGGFGL